MTQPDFKAQRSEVEEVLRPLVLAQKAREAEFETASVAFSLQDRQRAFDDLIRSFEAEERELLAPLAAQGNAEALYTLADKTRNAQTAEDVRRWFGLVTAASEKGHPMAQLELNRWYWHQRGDGSIKQVQRNRAISLDYAGKAAAAGNFFGISRIAVYISGQVHQYPAELRLARRLLELCAQTDDQNCQELLVLTRPYDYGLSPSESYPWLVRLARRQPERFSEARDLAYSRLSADEQASLTRQAEEWRPAEWATLTRQWADIQQDILAHGESSIGPDAPCTTATPWCRGQFVH